jgi:hypothetical protein
MKQIRRFIVLLLAMQVFIHSPVSAQICPSPENVQIQILEGPPQYAHVSWSVPSGSNVVGFILYYRVDGGAWSTLYLPASPTAYDVPLTGHWLLLEVEIASLCSDGSISSVTTNDINNLIIVDIVLAREDGYAESLVCKSPCEGSTHFFYSQGSGLGNGNPASIGILAGWGLNGTIEVSDLSDLSSTTNYETFNNNEFCSCMETHGGDFSNPNIVTACKLVARAYLSSIDYYLSVCNTKPKARDDDQHQKEILPDQWSIMIAPNPSDNEMILTVENMGEQTIQYSITDVFGRPIQTTQKLTSNQSIDVSNWLSGFYFLQVKDAKGISKTLRFVKK